MKLVSSNFREILPEAISPLTASLLTSDFERAMRTQYALYRWELREDLGPCVIVVNRKPFFNYEQLKDIAVNCWQGSEEALTRYLGIQGNPDEAHARVRSPRAATRAWRALRLGRKAAQGLTSDASITPPSGDLLERLQIERRRLYEALLSHLLIGTGATIIFHFTDSLIRALSVGRDNIATCIGALEDITGTASGRQQKEFAKLMRQWRDASNRSDNTEPNQFELSFRQYMSEFGHRCAYELDVAICRPEEDPDGTRKELARLGCQATPSNGLDMPRPNSFLHSWRRILLAPSMRWAVYREESKSIVSRRAGALRRILLEAERELPKGHDGRVFDIAIDNLIGSLVWHIISPRMREMPGEHAPQRTAAPPDYIDTQAVYGAVAAEERDNSSSSLLTGVPASSGVAIGLVRKIQRPEEAESLGKDSVLVVHALDSGWIVALISSIAIVTEVGGILSHAAIVAREHHLPAVFNVPRAMSLLPEGALVEVNGGTGQVRLLS